MDKDWIDNVFPKKNDWYLKGVEWLQRRGFVKHGADSYTYSLRSKDGKAFFYATVKARQETLAKRGQKIGWQAEAMWGDDDNLERGDSVRGEKWHKRPMNALAEIRKAVEKGKEYIMEDDKVDDIVDAMLDASNETKQEGKKNDK